MIPRGTKVAIHLYNVLHNPEYFPEPFPFKPEHWLMPEDGEEPESAYEQEARATMRRAQMTFGLGDRSCTGKSMAYLETGMTIARTMWYSDFSVAPGDCGKVRSGGEEGSKNPWAASEQYQLGDIFVADHDGPMLVLKARRE
ncbi:cytochrome P450 [Whalleya microplaca]|nr:cytochrome P450 [Whalleya microplaca]